MNRDNDTSKDPEHRGGKISMGYSGAGTPSEGDVQQRAEDLAVIDGRHAGDADFRHLANARRELIGGETQADDVLEPAEGISDRDDVPGATGRHLPNRGPGEEISVGEELVNEGSDEAVHEQMRAASETLDRHERGLGNFGR